jgi:hypothetical protein
VKSLESIFQAAKGDLAQYMSTQLKYNASQSNWPSSAIEGVNVNFDGSSMSLGISDEAYDDVMTYEYGTEVVRPTSVLRRTSNMSYDFEKYFVERIDSRLRR